MMIIQDRLGYDLWFTEINVLRRRIDQTAILVASQLPSQPEDMIGTLGTGCQEYDAKAGAWSFPPGFIPEPKNPILVCLVSEDLRADTLFTVRVEWFRGIVNFEDKIESPAGIAKLKMKIRLLPVLPDLQR